MAVCSDIDECATANGGCDTNAICVNTVGSYFCYCKLGYYGNARLHCRGKGWDVSISVFQLLSN